jgi:hypothetical protein
LMNQTELATIASTLDDQSAQGGGKTGSHSRSTMWGGSDLGLQAGHDVMHVFIPV